MLSISREICSFITKNKKNCKKNKQFDEISIDEEMIFVNPEDFIQKRGEGVFFFSGGVE